MQFDKVVTIKDNLSMQDVLSRYGFETDRAGFVCCPFHIEKTPSMKIYKKDFCCFGCGETGDVIDFVQKLFSLSFQDTLKRIDSDFSLNLYGKHSFEDLRKAHYRQKQMQAERERKKAEQERVESEYWLVFDEWKRLDDNLRKYAPKNAEEEQHPLFIEALQKIAYQRELLERAEERRKVV